MSVATRFPPEHVPILSRGKHRSPRKGACFMEFASYLAGERWSDHPACTHPLLAALARGVNDHTSDDGRQQLVTLIPSVIGLTGDDPRVDVRIALLCARTALPIVGFERQRVMAVGVLSCRQALAHFDDCGPEPVDEHTGDALAQTPRAAEWASQFTSEVTASIKGFRRIAAPSIVSSAVQGIAQACVPDPDAILRGLLAEAIRQARQLLSPPGSVTGAPGAVRTREPTEHLSG